MPHSYDRDHPRSEYNNRTPTNVFVNFIKTIVATVLFLILLVIKITVNANRNNLIIQFGIQTYRTISTATLILVILGAVAIFATGILAVIQTRNNIKKSMPEKPKPILSESQKTNSRRVKDLLQTTLQSFRNDPCYDHKELETRLQKCIIFLSKIDSYQEKLNNLLANNGADSLSDTKDVLNQVEQYICKKMLSVCNYISIVDTNDKNEVTKINKKIDARIEDVSKQLDQVQEFLFNLADFLNKQNDDDATPETLEIYKTLILKSINDDDEII